MYYLLFLIYFFGCDKLDHNCVYICCLEFSYESLITLIQILGFFSEQFEP